MNTNENHNIWTLTKHVAGSINKAAGKLDEKIYGSHTNPPPPPPPKKEMGWVNIGLGVLATVLILAVIVGKAYLNEKWTWRDFVP